MGFCAAGLEDTARSTHSSNHGHHRRRSPSNTSRQRSRSKDGLHPTPSSHRSSASRHSTSPATRRARSRGRDGTRLRRASRSPFRIQSSRLDRPIPTELKTRIPVPSSHDNSASERPIDHTPADTSVSLRANTADEKKPDVCDMPAVFKFNLNKELPHSLASAAGGSAQAESTSVPPPPASTPPPVPDAPPPHRAVESVSMSPRSGWISVTKHPTLEMKTDVPSAKNQMTAEEKRSRWAERIQLLASASTLRAESRRLESEVQDYTRITDSSRFAALPEEERAIVEAKRADAQAKYSAKADDFEVVLSKLAESDFWPFSGREIAHPAMPPLGPELPTQVRDLKDAVGELHDLLLAVSSRVQDGPVPVVDETKPVWRDGPNKRLRLQSHSPMAESSASRSKMTVEPEDMEGMQLRVSELEERVMDLEVSFRSHEDDVRDEVHVLLQERAEEAARAAAPPPAERLAALEGEWKVTGEQVEELSREMGELILRFDAVNKENVSLKMENEGLLRYIEQTDSQQKIQIETMAREILTLREAVSNHLASANIPVQSPPWAFDEMLDAIRPLLLQSLRKEMEPMLSDLRRSVEEMLRAHSQELMGSIIPKLNLTLQTVETIRAWTDRLAADPSVHPHT